MKPDELTELCAGLTAEDRASLLLFIRLLRRAKTSAHF